MSKSIAVHAGGVSFLVETDDAVALPERDEAQPTGPRSGRRSVGMDSPARGGEHAHVAARRPIG